MAPLLPFAAIALFLAAAATDLQSRRIPNAIPLALALVGLARIAVDLAGDRGLLLSGIDLLAAVALLALGAWAFRLRALGGGDVKLIFAAALWFGVGELIPFLLTTVLAGGALALVFVGRQMVLARGPAGAKGPDLPYAVAIAIGGILTTARPLWF